MHLTREIVSPVSNAKSVVEEYCNGNRIVSVSGSRTAIVDYDKSEVTEIDFAAGTYSVTKFEAIAKATEGMNPTVQTMTASAAREWRVEARGGSVVASRPGETIEAERTSNRVRQNIRVTADTQLTLSRGAVEALMGLSYPNTPDASASVILDALRPAAGKKLVANATSAAADDEYRLPLEHIVRFDLDGETLESRSVVTRLGNELAPPDILAIPPGAKLVESRAVAVRKELDELEHPASQR
ncbi:MAG TPA: hypothetical protein VKB93_26815 [Thermoanaerobaculia bacterium]|nr:hypothetical protein [Thermoanaerobaculia bacterium]